MKKKKEHCSHCGSEMKWGVDRADKYYYGAFWGMTKSRFASYNRDGNLQEVETLVCPNWQKSKWWQRENPHDNIWRKKDGIKYDYNYDDIISYF